VRITKSVGTSSGKQSPAPGWLMTHCSAVQTPRRDLEGVQPAEARGVDARRVGRVHGQAAPEGRLAGLVQKSTTPTMSEQSSRMSEGPGVRSLHTASDEWGVLPDLRKKRAGGDASYTEERGDPAAEPGLQQQGGAEGGGRGV